MRWWTSYITFLFCSWTSVDLWMTFRFFSLGFLWKWASGDEWSCNIKQKIIGDFHLYNWSPPNNRNTHLWRVGHENRDESSKLPNSRNAHLRRVGHKNRDKSNNDADWIWSGYRDLAIWSPFRKQTMHFLCLVWLRLSFDSHYFQFVSDPPLSRHINFLTLSAIPRLSEDGK